jgi:hypothetical protein
MHRNFFIGTIQFFFKYFIVKISLDLDRNYKNSFLWINLFTGKVYLRIYTICFSTLRSLYLYILGLLDFAFKQFKSIFCFDKFQN